MSRFIPSSTFNVAKKFSQILVDKYLTKIKDENILGIYVTNL